MFLTMALSGLAFLVYCMWYVSTPVGSGHAIDQKLADRIGKFVRYVGHLPLVRLNGGVIDVKKWDGLGLKERLRYGLNSFARLVLIFYVAPLSIFAALLLRTQ